VRRERLLHSGIIDCSSSSSIILLFRSKERRARGTSIAIIRKLLLREQLKPYLGALNQAAHERGAPPMRPLVYDFPADAAANLADEFMLGPDLLVASVLSRAPPPSLPAGQRHLGGRLE
jgi:hypothetical protein